LSGSAGRRHLQLQREHRRRDLDRHADDVGLGRRRRADHRELHPAGLGHFHGHGHDQRHDLDPNPANNTATATIGGVPAADLASTVTFPASVNAGQPVSGTVTYTNNGPSTASGVTFGLTLSAESAGSAHVDRTAGGRDYSYNSSTGVVTLTGMPATLPQVAASGRSP
jgi:hypothetical protein